MRKMMSKAKRSVEWNLWRAGQVLRGRSGEGFVDTAIASVRA